MSQVIRWDDSLKSDFKKWVDDKSSVLIIENHPTYLSYLVVNSFNPDFEEIFESVIGPYKAIHKLDIYKLLEAAEKEQFSVVFINDPQEVFDFVDSLNDPLPVKLNVNLFPFQLRGFNYLKDLDASICNWSTGTGKSVWAVTWSKYLLETNQIDKIIVLSKSHNKYNWQRQYKGIGDLDSITDEDVKGSNKTDVKRERRETLYADNQIIILNYEKLRFRPENEKERFLAGRKLPSSSGDGAELLKALKGKRVAWILDEAPSKLKSMNTGWYKGLSKLQSKTKSNKITALTATKIEKNPEDLYAWIKVLDKQIWPTKVNFRYAYARSMIGYQVLSWDASKLPEIGMKIAHFTSKADKYLDPDIRDQFPESHHEDVYIQLYPTERRIYDALKKEIKDQDLLTISSLAPLQIAVNNVSYLKNSTSPLAQKIADQFRPSDSHVAKIDKLHDMLDEIPGKVVIFSAYTEFGSLMLADYLTKWGYWFALYDGDAKKKQMAQDAFNNNPKIKIFLSSDQGSDSINLEQAASVIHYDLPWNSSTFIQRMNRIHRITSKHLHVYSYSLIADKTLEEGKLDTLERKRVMELAVDEHLTNQEDLMRSFSSDQLREMI